MKPIIRVEGLSKEYRLGRRDAPYSTLRESLTRAVQAPYRRLRRGSGAGPALDGNPEADRYWALKDVGFEVRPGEVVGVIGRNGAGKSTLLKVLSRVTEPTRGRVELFGRVGSLLEVGTGFHPELSGRENIFLNGAILGMGRREIVRKLDEIIAFAEVEKFVDTPVKRYSSGMYTRLAFAVASHLDPEVLVIDEVLAVGDAQFQKKCIGKMGDAAREGRTILFVSHNMVAIQAMCSNCLWLQGGELLASGPTADVVRTYLNSGSNLITTQVWDSPASAPGNDRIRLRSVRLVPPRGETPDTLSIRMPFDIEFEYWNLKNDSLINLSISITEENNICVFNSNSVSEGRWDGSNFPVGLFRSTCSVPGDLLNDGTYRVSVLFVENRSHIIYKQDELLEFEVRDDFSDRGGWYGKWPGVTRPRLRWATELLGSNREY